MGGWSFHILYIITFTFLFISKIVTLSWLGDMLSVGASGREWALHYLDKECGWLVAHHRWPPCQMVVRSISQCDGHGGCRSAIATLWYGLPHMVSHKNLCLSDPTLSKVVVTVFESFLCCNFEINFSKCTTMSQIHEVTYWIINVIIFLNMMIISRIQYLSLSLESRGVKLGNT